MSWRALMTVGIVLFVTGSASAQPTNPVSRPAFSPYLNLNRPGGSPTLNYYGLVRPEIQARQSIQGLQGSVAANQQAIGGLQTELTELPGTGHQATFLNYRSYFLTGGAGGGGGTTYGSGGAYGSGVTVRTPQTFSSPRR
jgi:hypothetical protein